MSAVSVVQYHQSPHKLNILQQSHTNNREIIILRKPTNAPPLKPYDKELIKKKSKGIVKDVVANATNAPPVAVARRNARERNRVKQVNNGFATLRQHIPSSIAAAFETTAGRGGNKKLSKVETLRMAVEYIRSLEDILSGDEPREFRENISNESISTSYLSSNPSSPTLNATNLSYNYMMSPSNDEDDLSTNPTPPPQHQYMRINGANYHIVSGNIYDDTENLEPLDEKFLQGSSLMDADIELGNQELSLLTSMHHTTGSLSPGMYSDNSMSPPQNNNPQNNNQVNNNAQNNNPQNNNPHNNRQMFIPVFNSRDLTNQNNIKFRISPDEIKVEPPVLSMENEHEIPIDSKDNMIQVMAWWEQQQLQQQTRS